MHLVGHGGVKVVREQTRDGEPGGHGEDAVDVEPHRRRDAGERRCDGVDRTCSSTCWLVVGRGLDAGNYHWHPERHSRSFRLFLPICHWRTRRTGRLWDKRGVKAVVKRGRENTDLRGRGIGTAYCLG